MNVNHTDVIKAIDEIKKDATKDIMKIISNYHAMCGNILQNVNDLAGNIDALGKRDECYKFRDRVNGCFSNIIEALTGSY